MTRAQKNLQPRSSSRNVRWPVFPFEDSQEKFFRWVNVLGPGSPIFSFSFLMDQMISLTELCPIGSCNAWQPNSFSKYGTDGIDWDLKNRQKVSTTGYRRHLPLLPVSEAVLRPILPEQHFPVLWTSDHQGLPATNLQCGWHWSRQVEFQDDAHELKLT